MSVIIGLVVKVLFRAACACPPRKKLKALMLASTASAYPAFNGLD